MSTVSTSSRCIAFALYHSSSPAQSSPVLRCCNCCPSKLQESPTPHSRKFLNLVLDLVSPYLRAWYRRASPVENSSGIPYRSFQKLHNGNDRPRFRTASKAQFEASPESTSPLRAGQYILCLPKFPAIVRQSAYCCLCQNVIRRGILGGFSKSVPGFWTLTR